VTGRPTVVVVDHRRGRLLADDGLLAMADVAMMILGDAMRARASGAVVVVVVSRGRRRGRGRRGGRRRAVEDRRGRRGGRIGARQGRPSQDEAAGDGRKGEAQAHSNYSLLRTHFGLWRI
jgi:hypothetical protein